MPSKISRIRILDAEVLLRNFIVFHLENYRDIKKVMFIKYFSKLDRYFSLYHIFFDINSVETKIARSVAKYALKIDENNIIYMMLLANNYLCESEQQKAEKYLFRALKIDDSFIHLLYYKYKLFSRYYGEYDAYRVLKEILNKNSKDIFALYYITMHEKDTLRNIEYTKQLLNSTFADQEFFHIITNIEEPIIHYAKKLLRKLSTQEYFKLFYKNSDYYTDMCSVCYSHFGKLNVVKLICGHYFHSYCVKDTVRQCPICREDVIFLRDTSELNLVDLCQELNENRSDTPDTDV